MSTSRQNTLRHFTSHQDWSHDELLSILDLAEHYRDLCGRGEIMSTLLNQTVFALFMGPSTRTRATLESAVTLLGGHMQYIQANSTRLVDDEAIKDIARVYSRLGSALAIRTDVDAVDYFYGKGRELLDEFAEHSQIPVINLADCREHPTQGLADIMTMKQSSKEIQGKKFVIYWAYSHYQRDLTSVQEAMTLLPRFGVDVTICAPPEFDLDPQMIRQAEQYAGVSGSKISFCHSPEEALQNASFIFPRNWRPWSSIARPPQSILTHHSDLSTHLKEWRLTDSLLDKALPDCRVMHVLPVMRGEEADDAVMDSERSLIFDQVENKLYAQMAILHRVVHKTFDTDVIFNRRRIR